MKARQRSKVSLFIMLLLCLFVTRTWSQTEADPNAGKHELKLNGLHILLESFEVGYDYILGEQSSVGMSLAYSLNDDNGFDFMIMPNYKLFFNEKKAAGFYIELNSAIITDDSDVDYGMGIAIGGKFINRKNFIGEIVLGGGRFFNDDGGYPRIGISLGKRF